MTPTYIYRVEIVHYVNTNCIASRPSGTDSLRWPLNALGDDGMHISVVFG
jgi:hypothetical protein